MGRWCIVLTRRGLALSGPRCRGTENPRIIKAHRFDDRPHVLSTSATLAACHTIPAARQWGIVLPSSSTGESASYGGSAAAVGTSSPRAREAAAALAAATGVVPLRRCSAHSCRCAEVDRHEVRHLPRHLAKHCPLSEPLSEMSPGGGVARKKAANDFGRVVAPAPPRDSADEHRAAHRWTQPVEQSRAFGAVVAAQSSPPNPSAQRHVPSWHSPWPEQPIRHERVSQWSPP